ncbi:MAG: ABC transporter permease [Defluviitaleaceae bacterium]|nr:ABC transporter permease [Defluviitaleaceae bacterium]MCL2836958.1 ABC transporter permease [Defluviitaleaceae bacterium]
MSKPGVKTSHAGTPFVWIVKRDSVSRKQAYLVRAAAILGALMLGAALFLAMGHNPIMIYRDMLTGSLGRTLARTETVRIAIPLLVTALGIGLAFKMRFWNIGAEGQIIMGATAASYFALFSGVPGPYLLFVMFFAAIAAGGLWGLIPAVFKSKWNTNETLFTLMLNYIALEFVRYLQFGPWRDPRLRGFPSIAMFDQAARLPRVFGVHIGWIFALILVAIVYIYMKKTRHGYEITVVGESIPTARYAGINVGRVFLRTMFLSGAICGLTGFLIVSGANFTLSEMVTGGVGFTAITVAWLSRLNPAVMIIFSLFIAMLQRGANAVQTTFRIPSSAADILIGFILFFILGCEFFLNYKLVFRKKVK